MLITTIQEIKSYMPTSKWAESDLHTLLTLLEEEEEYLAAHHLGYPLHEQLCADYASKKDELGGILSLHVDSPDITIKILRDCQRIILFRMLANNSGIFSVSFNKGGGINMMSAQDYDVADKEHIKNFERDCWGKARRNTENLLLHLEADAKGGKQYTLLWHDSEYYFYHKDLLFTTASDLNHYLNIDNSRERYVQLRPKMRQLQTAHLISAIGNPLWQDLLKVSQGESQAIDSPLTETEPTSVSGDSTLDNAVLTDLKISLANYLEDADTGNKSKTGNPLLDAANRHRALAVQTILDNADDFDKYITKGSPLAYAWKDAHDGEEYIPIAYRPTEAEQIIQAHHSPCHTGERGRGKGDGIHSYDRHNPHNAVFDFGGFGHKR